MDRVDSSGCRFSAVPLAARGVMELASNFSEARIENATSRCPARSRRPTGNFALRAHGTHRVTGVSTRSASNAVEPRG